MVFVTQTNHANHAPVLVYDWLVWVNWKGGGGATKASDAKKNQNKRKTTKAGQLSPSLLAGISQSERAAEEA